MHERSRHFAEGFLRDGETGLRCVENGFRFREKCLGHTDCGLDEGDYSFDGQD